MLSLTTLKPMSPMQSSPVFFKPHNYQIHCYNHLYQHDKAGLFLDMGLGKTVITLLALSQFITEHRSRKILIVAPKRVAEHTWTDEARKWSQTSHLSLSVVAGGRKGEAGRKEALRKPANIYVIGVDNFAWLVALYGSAWPFDTLVIDELSMFKDNGSKRFKAACLIMPLVSRVIGLTGTPMPNGLIDLWSQIYLLDGGERLGKTITAYRNEYFDKGKQLSAGNFEYNLKQGDAFFMGSDIYEKCISNKISDICISMQAKDYLDLPPRIDEVRKVYMPDALFKEYKKFERESVLELFGHGEVITAVNAAALSGKLLQFANGAVYADANRTTWQEIHGEKIEALGEMLAAANGEPMLVLYSFRHDIVRIKHSLGRHFRIMDMTTPNVLNEWNARRIPVLLGHPKSMGHGLNMQDGGNLVTSFGLNWSSELYRQVIARLHRQGQQRRVINSRLACVGTLDEEVIDRMDGKIAREDSFLDYIKAIVNEHVYN